MRSGQTSVQQLLLFDPGNTEVPGEPAAVVVDSEAVVITAVPPSEL